MKEIYINESVNKNEFENISSQYWHFIEYFLYIHLCIHIMRVCGAYITIHKAYVRAHASKVDPRLLCKRNKIDYLTSILHIYIYI